MKRIFVLLTAMVMVFGLVVSAHALLIDNGDGTVTDTDTSLMWLQDANLAATETFGVSGISSYGYMNWYTANNWVDAMNTASYLGYSDWRLPDTNPVNGSGYNYGYSYDGSTDYGHNISAPGSAYPGSTASEMAYMFYNSLGNLGYYDTSGNGQSGYGLANTGLFANMQSNNYWSGTEFAITPIYAWYFGFNYGHQYALGKDNNDFYAWAVRPAAVAPVPEPGTMLLLGSGLAGLVGFRKRFKTRTS